MSHPTTIDATVPSGLTDDEAARRLAAYGPNEVRAERPTRLLSRVGRQLVDPLVALLLIAAVVTLALGDIPDTAVILLVVVVNTAIGVTQEVKADRAVTALHQAAAPTAHVLRGGASSVLPASQVVPGDLMVLTAGDIIAADAVLREAERVTLDESALTGESLPVSRSAGDEVSAGTVMLTGRATAQAERTGPDSALGRIAVLVAAAKPGPTPLQRRLTGLGRVLGLAAVGLSLLVMVLGLLAGRPLAEMAITAVSLVVAAVPESLPAVVTLALALGAARMAREHAIVRRLDAVETLGSVTVLASDKTGTVTEGRMAVDRAVTTQREYQAHGAGYEPAGWIESADGRLEPPPEMDVRELARAAALCNDAVLLPPVEPGGAWAAAGDPVEAALLAFAWRAGVDVTQLQRELPRVGERPFDLTARCMTTAHAMDGGRFLILRKGAPEVIEACHSLAPAAAELAARGLRVLALAGAVADSADLDARLRPLGLVGIGDPLRPEAASVAGVFAAAGVRLVMITGDHPVTAAVIAGRLGIWTEGDPVGVGGELDDAVIRESRVFARISPESKLDIIAALQRDGQVVAMTGDGVNDSPALRQADIGIAMGAGGTQVARQAADLVLTDDNLATVGVAIGEGRRVYDNIRRFLWYALAGGVAEVAVMLLGPFVGLGVPLLPAQILWINLLTHGLPGVALGAEPADPAVLRRPPRQPHESVLGAGLARLVVTTGALIALSALGVGVWAFHAGWAWQSMVFVTLGLAQLAVAVAVRAPRRRGQPGNPWLGAAVAFSAVLQVAAVTFAPLRSLLGTETLDGPQLLLCAVAGLLPGLLLALTRRQGAGRSASTSQLAHR